MSTSNSAYTMFRSADGFRLFAVALLPKFEPKDTVAEYAVSSYVVGGDNLDRAVFAGNDRESAFQDYARRVDAAVANGWQAITDAGRREYADAQFARPGHRWCYSGEHCGSAHPVGPTHQVKI